MDAKQVKSSPFLSLFFFFKEADKFTFFPLLVESSFLAEFTRRRSISTARLYALALAPV